MTEEIFCVRIPLNEICDYSAIGVFWRQSIKQFHDNIVDVVVVVFVVVVVNRKFLLNYVALRNLRYAKFKNMLVLPIKTNRLIILPTMQS
jgi:hypothetical protein